MSVKVEDLIKMLSGLPQNAIVVLSSDQEGNSLCPLDKSYSIGFYAEGEFATTQEVKEDPESKPAYSQAAIILWPE